MLRQKIYAKQAWTDDSNKTGRLDKPNTQAHTQRSQEKHVQTQKYIYIYIFKWTHRIRSIQWMCTLLDVTCDVDTTIVFVCSNSIRVTDVFRSWQFSAKWVTRGKISFERCESHATHKVNGNEKEKDNNNIEDFVGGKRERRLSTDLDWSWTSNEM